MTSDPTPDDGVLTPDELSLEDGVAELGDNRYLVRTDESDDAAATNAALTGHARRTGTDLEDRTADTVGIESGSSARTRGALADAAEPHGIDIALKTDGEIAHHYATSHDVREVFVDLLTWYAGQLDDDMSPEEALGVMLAASDLEV
ncbi:DUF7500 family protein [Natronorubrum halophilum]|uniref:DUF7500 family protein n=1 Tax=Natronorubrum halophilum TaxID=1702106 RepID=UPI000EF673F9|nr:hypothetical protein [Natronorubrum halophilum]